MSQLAFDKEGQPFEFLAQAESLWVRRFRNPGARGTCEVLYDEEDELLHVDTDATLAELRRAVGHVPGLYRLDQCDETGAVIEKAPPAYATIDPPRNGLLPGGSAEPLAIVRDMAAINADVSKTLADRAAGMMEAMAGCVRDMRSAFGGDPSRRLLALMAKVAGDQPAIEADDDSDDEGDDEELEELPADPLAALGPLAPMVAAMAPKIGEAIAAKVVELMTQIAKPSPAATSTTSATHESTSAPAPTSAGPAPQDVAAGPRPAEPQPAAPAPSPASSASSATDVPTQATPVVVPATEAAAPAADAPRNAAPTADQLTHLFAIRAALSPREVAIVDGVIARMDGATAAQWIAELCALSVEQAVARVRALIPQPAAKPGRSEP